MILKCFLFLIFFITAPLLGADRRPTKITTGYTSGNNSYSENQLGLNLGLTQKLLLTADYTKTDEKSFMTTAYTVGGDYLFNDNLSLYLEFLRSENDDQLKGQGFYTGGSYEIGHLFHNKKETEISLDLGRVNYSQKANLTNVNESGDDDETTLAVNRSYTQKSIGIGLDQEITDYLSLGLYTKRYTYDDYTAPVVSKRRGEIFTSPESSTNNSILKSSNIHASIYPTFAKWFSLYLRLGESTYKDGGKTKEQTIAPQLSYSNIKVGLSYSESKSGGKTQTYLSPTISFGF